MILVTAIILAVLGVVEMPWAAVLIGAAAAVEVAESLLLLAWSRRRRSAVGVEALVGRRGVAVSDLSPDGQVKVDGELWNARAAAGIDAGADVIVRAIEGLTLDVERA